MEPERNIEKELKAYAQQRRAAAGTPRELHPVNRKSLLDEAARLSNTGGGKARSRWHRFWTSWPRLIVAGGGIAVVVLAVLFLHSPENNDQNGLPPMETRRMEKGFREQTAAKNDTLRDAKMPAPLPAKPIAVAASPAPETVNKALALESANRGASAALSAPAPMGALPPSPAPATTPTLTVAKDRGFSGGTHSLSLDSETAASQTTRSDTAALTPPRAFGGSGPADVPTALVMERFRRTDLPKKADMIAGRAGASNVLAAFRVEQTLDKLRMIDSDGSIYTGFVAQTPETAKQAGTVFYKLGAEKGKTSSAGGDKQLQPMRAYRFRVSGTNRTLKEEIVFTGDFFARTGVKSLLPAPAFSTESVSGAIAPSGIPTELLPLELSNSLMQGRLLLGETNKIEINAVPVKP